VTVAAASIIYTFAIKLSTHFFFLPSFLTRRSRSKHVCDENQSQKQCNRRFNSLLLPSFVPYTMQSKPVTFCDGGGGVDDLHGKGRRLLYSWTSAAGGGGGGGSSVSSVSGGGGGSSVSSVSGGGGGSSVSGGGSGGGGNSGSGGGSGGVGVGGGSAGLKLPSTTGFHVGKGSGVDYLFVEIIYLRDVVDDASGVAVMLAPVSSHFMRYPISVETLEVSSIAIPPKARMQQVCRRCVVKKRGVVVAARVHAHRRG
jgi:hypothetical protein